MRLSVLVALATVGVAAAGIYPEGLASTILTNDVRIKIGSQKK